MALIHSMADRIQSRVQIDPATGCWNWQGQIEHHGYGRTSYKGRPQYVHRVAYETFVGLIGDGLTIDHLCRNRACCNPAHLDAVTLLENLRRAPRCRADQCVNGHPRTPENTAMTARQGPRCRECLRAAWRRKNARRRTAVSA